jgi:hypothetical protein
MNGLWMGIVLIVLGILSWSYRSSSGGWLAVIDCHRSIRSGPKVARVTAH